MKKSNRTYEQIREHYEVEKELANRLRNSSSEERKILYSSIYNELFRRIPHHPQVTRKKSKEEAEKYIASQIRDIASLVNSKTVFLEVGPGDCAFAIEMTKSAKMVYAVDVSEEITRNPNLPKNFKLILSNGCNIPLPPNSVNVAYSNQLMEHLHTEDAEYQLKEIYNALEQGGIYFCITPNRLYGPSDISEYFDETATGLHMKEYTIKELDHLFRQIGFRKTKVLLRVKRIRFTLPTYPFIVMENIIDLLPRRQKKAIAQFKPISIILGIKIIGIK
jgi:SAM-dependent methyltransferase